MTRPAPVTGLIAIPFNGAISLEWDASDDTSITAHKYQITPSPEDGSNIYVGHTIPDSGHGEWHENWVYIDGLTNGTHYTVIISAINDDGFSLSADPVHATPHEVPEQPTGLIAVPRDGSVLLEWDAPTDRDVDFHKVLVTPPPGKERGIEILTVPDSAYGESNEDGYLVGGLTNDWYYVFSVFSANHKGLSFRADPVYAKPSENEEDRESGVPSVYFPNDLPQDDDDDDDDDDRPQGQPGWASGPSIFKIPAFPGIPFVPLLPAPGLGEGQPIDDGDDDGEGGGGSGGNFSEPAKIRGLEAWPTNNAVLLTWDDPEDSSITNYQYLIDYITGGDFAVVTIPNLGYNGYWVMDLGAEEAFRFTLRAVNANGAGEYSDSVLVSTPSDDIIDDGPGEEEGGSEEGTNPGDDMI